MTITPEILASFKLVTMFLFCHLVGDYFLQSDWMAMNKSKKTLNCLVHVIIYTACFLVLTVSWKALLFIGVTHFILDRFPVIIKRFIWLKNHINPKFSYPPYSECSNTGYFDDFPTMRLDQAISKYGAPRFFHITVFLYIVTDNTLHLICNYIALAYLS